MYDTCLQFAYMNFYVSVLWKAFQELTLARESTPPLPATPPSLIRNSWWRYARSGYFFLRGMTGSCLWAENKHPLFYLSRFHKTPKFMPLINSTRFISVGETKTINLFPTFLTGKILLYCPTSPAVVVQSI